MLALLTLTVGLLLIASGESFLMTRVKPGLVTVQPGEEINLLCVVDSAYELCTWYNPQHQHCDFEWKRMSGHSVSKVEKTVFSCRIRHFLT